MPPKALPGFYWDESRNRYFPLSSLPPRDPRRQPSSAAPLRPTPDSSKGWTNKRRRKEGPSGPTQMDGRPPPAPRKLVPLWHALQSSRTSQSAIVRSYNAHTVLADQYASTSLMDCSVTMFMPKDTHITAFCTRNINDRPYRFLGDSRGWISSFEPASSTSEDGSHVHGMPPHWTMDLPLGSQISALCCDDQRLVATSFGPNCKIVVRDLSPGEESRTAILTPSPSQIYDVWTASLQGKRLVLGMSKRAMWKEDVDTNAGFGRLDSGSDVFALCQQDSVVLTGTRNGTITRFDLRTAQSRQQGYAMFNDYSTRYQGAERRSSVTELRSVREWELLVAAINGELELHDLRFPRASRPIMSFRGHVNSYTPKLGLAIDPTHSFLFAAGDDNVIRGWSLRSGDPLVPPPLRTLPTSTSSPSPTSSSFSMAQSIAPASRTPPPTHARRTTTPSAYAYDPALGALDPQTQNPLTYAFKHPVRALDVSWERNSLGALSAGTEHNDEDGREEGLTLWATSGNRLHEFYLGRFDADGSSLGI